MIAEKNQSIAFIHIRKCGGTALKRMLGDDHRFSLCKHKITLETLWRDEPSQKVFFVVRDPIGRFVSGFNSRLRQGAPAHNSAWLPQEAVAFECFHNPNQLAEGLSSQNKWERLASHLAMLSINHVRHPLKTWLHSVEFLEEHREKIIYVGLLSKLQDEIPVMRKYLGFSDTCRLPDNDEAAHRAPEGSSAALSEVAERNIADWYADDYPLYEWCLDFRRGLGLHNS